jgi:hypothetical protein
LRFLDKTHTHTHTEARAHTHTHTGTHTHRRKDQLVAETSYNDDALAFSWVRTRGSKSRAASDLRLRPHGYRVRLNICYRHENKFDIMSYASDK